ncbi:hypothetical protein HDV05_002230 [Chytridiales sp. JEL 0842]|nr:hypothetical protein HDV05_002230 [Chytridiales sp. JEL 0842]
MDSPQLVPSISRGSSHSSLAPNVQDLSLLRARCAILKKAVLDEQDLNKSIQAQLKAKDQKLREALQQLDLQTHHNDTLTKRIEALQVDLKQASRLRKSMALEPPGDLSVLSEELQGKIMENEKLHRKLAELSSECTKSKTNVERQADQIHQLLEEKAQLDEKFTILEESFSRSQDEQKRLRLQHDFSQQKTLDEIMIMEKLLLDTIQFNESREDTFEESAWIPQLLDSTGELVQGLSKLCEATPELMRILSEKDLWQNQQPSSKEISEDTLPYLRKIYTLISSIMSLDYFRQSTNKNVGGEPYAAQYTTDLNEIAIVMDEVISLVYFLLKHSTSDIPKAYEIQTDHRLNLLLRRLKCAVRALSAHIDVQLSHSIKTQAEMELISHFSHMHALMYKSLRFAYADQIRQKLQASTPTTSPHETTETESQTFIIECESIESQTPAPPEFDSKEIQTLTLEQPKIKCDSQTETLDSAKTDTDTQTGLPPQCVERDIQVFIPFPSTEASTTTAGLNIQRNASSQCAIPTDTPVCVDSSTGVEIERRDGSTSTVDEGFTVSLLNGSMTVCEKCNGVEAEDIPERPKPIFTDSSTTTESTQKDSSASTTDKDIRSNGVEPEPSVFTVSASCALSSIQSSGNLTIIDSNQPPKVSYRRGVDIWDYEKLGQLLKQVQVLDAQFVKDNKKKE